jgi:hypothetical protein
MLEKMTWIGFSTWLVDAVRTITEIARIVHGSRPFAMAAKLLAGAAFTYTFQAIGIGVQE